MTAPLMPKATAVWLVENTALTFRQIAAFCELHELEVHAIADGDIAYNIIGISPVATNQLTMEEIRRCEANPAELLVANVQELNVKIRNIKTKKMLSPSQRNDKPAAILWIIKNYPEIIDSQICKIIGTTKPTITSIREGTHRDIQNIRPKNPVAVGLCTEKDLESALRISEARNNPKPKKEKTKKKTAKKATNKNAVAKKTTAKKKVAKKTEVKKVVAKKAISKKNITKKTVAKKAAPKKTIAKKTVAKKTTAKKAVVKKVAVKKVATKKASVKKTVSAKKAVAKKKTSAKAITKKVATKKAPAKKTVAKKK